MRILSVAVAIAMLSSQGGAIAAPGAGLAQTIKAPSAVELVKMHKRYKKHMKSEGSRGYAAPGHCGSFKYYKKGKCLSAMDKKDSK